mgnify:CR=1 FL=1
MKCEDCGEMFMLPELQFKADGMVPNTHIKKYRAQCKACAGKIRIDATTMKDDHEYPF